MRVGAEIDRGLATALLALSMTTTVPAMSDVRECASVRDGAARIVTFEARNAEGTPLQVDAVLMAPRGVGAHPALILLPGGGGMSVPRCYRLAMEEFVDWGYAVLLVDSNSGVTPEGERLSAYSFADQAAHARWAATHLVGRREIDARRIGVWGFSHGGLSVIEAVAGRAKSDIRAAVAASPICPAQAEKPAIPLLLTIGAKDTQVSVTACLDLAERWRDLPAFEFLLLPDSGHFYDMPSSTQYNEVSATLSTHRLKNFLTRHLLAPE